MNSTALVIMLGAALISTGVVVLGIPRARNSSLFNRILWVATALVSFLGAWLALPFGETVPAFQSLNMLRVSDVPVVPVALGAFAGALVVNAPLWLMDRVAASSNNDATDET